MESRGEELARLAERVEKLAEELKLLSLNLTVANAKLRVKDTAFQAVNASMNEMLDNASIVYDEAALALKKARGADVESTKMERKPVELDAYLDRISGIAEYIIRTVVALKQGRGVDQRL